MMKLINKRMIASLIVSTSLLGAVTTNTVMTVANADAVTSTNQKKTKPSGKKPNQKPSGKGGGSTPGGNSSASSAKLSGTKTVSGTETVSGDVKATTKNQSAVYVKKGGQLTLKDATVNKTGATSNESNSNFYGQNAGVVVTKGGSATITNLNETTNADGANAVFSTGSGSKVTLNKAKITTYKDSSRGLDATQKGQIDANDVTITTHGSHSATLANDRGGGTVNVDQGTLNTNGDGSPVIYSTGAITVKDVTGNAGSAEASVTEGANTVNITDSNLTANKNNGVMLYQSMSGDANEGTAHFTMNGGSLTSNVKSGSKGTTKNTGALFYVTNTKANASLTNVKLTNASDTLIRVASDRWGTSGKNGGQLTFTAKQQTLNGNVEVAKNSSLNLSLTNDSKLDGAINSANAGGTVKLSLDSTSQWNVTKDSYLTTLSGSKDDLSNIKSNGHNVYYNKSNSGNSWLDGKTYSLSSGGKLMPK